jgi:hypothetical protein
MHAVKATRMTRRDQFNYPSPLRRDPFTLKRTPSGTLDPLSLIDEVQFTEMDRLSKRGSNAIR